MRAFSVQASMHNYASWLTAPRVEPGRASSTRPCLFTALDQILNCGDSPFDGNSASVVRTDIRPTRAAGRAGNADFELGEVAMRRTAQLAAGELIEPA